MIMNNKDRESLEAKLRLLISQKKAIEVMIEHTKDILYRNKVIQEYLSNDIQDKDIEHAFILSERTRLKQKMQAIDKVIDKM